MEVVNAKSVKTLNLENRLIDFAVLILEISDNLPGKRSCNHLGDQLMRSGTSPALNYGEAQFAESRNDFIHKIKICLKELKESKICLTIIERREYFSDKEKLILAIKEVTELVNIFTKSAKTASENKITKR
ncbi:MAG: four helix bundle protein [Bacteroidota bacterium]|nr:four helix bundle protein [Bacteroidota bacterium]